MSEEKKVNELIEKSFSYDLPDEYLFLTNTLKRRGTWTYKGPRYMWIFADETTKKIIGRFHYTESNDGEHVPTPIGQIKIMIDADVNPVMAAMIHNEHDYATLPQKVTELPCGGTYSTPDPQAPDHTYEITQIIWNTETEEFVFTYPDCWKKPHSTWDEVIGWRNSALSGSDLQYKNASTPEIKAAWAEYRQKLRDIPVLYAEFKTHPWMISFPNDPDKQPIAQAESTNDGSVDNTPGAN